MKNNLPKDTTWLSQVPPRTDLQTPTSTHVPISYCFNEFRLTNDFKSYDEDDSATQNALLHNLNI